MDPSPWALDIAQVIFPEPPGTSLVSLGVDSRVLDTPASGSEALTDGPFAGQILEALDTAVLVTDSAGRVVFANPRAAHVLGRGPGLLGMRLAELLPDVARQIGAEASSDAPPRSRCRGLLPDGREITIGFSVSEIGRRRLDRNREHLAILFQDITGFEKVREERDRLLQLAAVGEVLPSVLHELKNPLAAITTAVEVLLEDIAPGHLQDDLHAVLSEVRRIKLTLEGIGLVSHGLSGTRDNAVDFALMEAFRVLEAQMKRKGIVATCDVPSLPLLPFDAAAIRAILFNLVTNAIHACRPGDAITLQAGLSPGKGDFFLSVADTGCGMPSDVMERCRELFFTTKPNGSGIGLPLCVSVVERAGGQLSIESTVGRGTRVTVRLPIAPKTRRSPDTGAIRVARRQNIRTEEAADVTNR